MPEFRGHDTGHRPCARCHDTYATIIVPPHQDVASVGGGGRVRRSLVAARSFRKEELAEQGPNCMQGSVMGELSKSQILYLVPRQ